MPVQLNHTIVAARDPHASATFLAEVLGLPAPVRFAHFEVVTLGNGVSLDYARATAEIAPQHYAFLVSEAVTMPITLRGRIDRQDISCGPPAYRGEDSLLRQWLQWLGPERARMIRHCFRGKNPNMIEEVRGVIRWSIPGEVMHTVPPTPNSRDWSEVIEVQCKDMNTTELRPVDAGIVPQTADSFVYLRLNFIIGDWRLDRAFFNQSSWRANPFSPTYSWNTKCKK